MRGGRENGLQLSHLTSTYMKVLFLQKINKQKSKQLSKFQNPRNDCPK